MRYLLACPCGNAVSVARSQAGSVVTCPVCNANIEVPTIRGLAQLPEDKSEIATETVSKSTKSHWSLPLGIAAAFCFITLLISCGIGSLWAVQRWSMPTDFTIEDELAYGDTMVDDYLPSELWDASVEYRVQGVSGKQPSNYFQWKYYLETRDKYMYGAFAVSAIALLGLVATVIISRRKPAASPA